jgi:excisionase family DNA binding protein
MDSRKAADVLGVDVGFVMRAVRKGQLRAARIGRALRIRGVDLLAFLDAHPARDEHGKPLRADGNETRQRLNTQLARAEASHVGG